jgi:two-component system chemotaxis response regulator CheB
MSLGFLYMGVTRDIIVIGASAGGVTALKKLTAKLPPNLDASVFVVLHTGVHSPGLMDQILTRAGDLPASYATDGELIERGKIYIAPKDHHLLLDDGKIQVVRGPKENGHRPAIDTLFRSAAVHYSRRVVGVILTGHLNDGTSGLIAVKQAGGMAIVQDPEEAEVPDMPESALRHVDVDRCLSLDDIPTYLGEITTTPILEGEAPLSIPETLKIESQIPTMSTIGQNVTDQLGKRSTLTCPECNGTLWEMNDDKMLRFRCHTGHGFSAEALALAEDEAVEKALWLALKTLEESGSLALRMAAKAEEEEHPFRKQLLESRAKKASEQAAVLRKLLQH